MRVHKLKIWPHFFKEILEDRKRFEYRRNDREYKKGDFLELEEFNQEEQKYTGRKLTTLVTYSIDVLNEDGNLYSIMSITKSGVFT